MVSGLRQAAFGLDVAVFGWINGHRHPFLDYLLGAASATGEMGAVWLVVCALMFFFGRQEHKRAAVVLLVALLLLDGLIGGTIKVLLPRARPYLILPGVDVWGMAWENASFPSGHAYASALAAVILGKKFPRTMFPLCAFAVLTCYSRPYFGMHYPSDVLTGAVLGVAAGLVALRMEKVWEGANEVTKPRWWKDPPVLSLFFSLVGVGMMTARSAGLGTQPLGPLGLGVMLGVASLGSSRRSRKWLGALGGLVGLLGLGMALMQWVK